MDFCSNAVAWNWKVLNSYEKTSFRNEETAYDRIKAIAGYNLIVACFSIGGIMSFYMLHPKEIEKIRCEKKAIIVDVRERTQYVQYHYKNAVNIPYSEDEGWLNQFCGNRVYILYCEHGNVSLLAARRLSKRGIMVYTVIGGINASWSI